MWVLLLRLDTFDITDLPDLPEASRPGAVWMEAVSPERGEPSGANSRMNGGVLCNGTVKILIIQYGYFHN